MENTFLEFHRVAFTYETSPEPLFQDVSFHLTSGWSGVVGANGAGKTTLLQLAAGRLTPNEGFIDSPPKAVYCPQRTDDIPDRFNEFMLSHTKSAYILKSRLDVRDDWEERWPTLSHGERRRAQIAVALWLEPLMLAMDEPTNHLDSPTRDIISKALHSFDGIGLLVSHDRELVDSLCHQCIFVEPPDVVIRSGGITKGMDVAEIERQAMQKQYDRQVSSYKKLQKEAARRRELAKQSRKRMSKKGLGKKDRDAREKIDRARVSGKDGVGGKMQRQLQGRLSQARKALDNMTISKQNTLGIWLPGSRSQRDIILSLPADSLSLGEQKRLSYPEIFITPDDRIALTGPNGSGKSTLIRFIIDSLTLPAERVVYLPQEIDAHRSRNIVTQVRELPNDRLGHLMTIINRLGSHPQRVLDTNLPSPGEIRKLLLALGMTRAPHIIIMDEPTNHMDLPSVECLERALLDCPCSLLLVSHDRCFLDKLVYKHWAIVEEDRAGGDFIMQIMQQSNGDECINISKSVD